MGKLTGNAATLYGGEIINISIYGENVQDGELPDIVSINTQMDGGDEYSPMRITTATISLLTDGPELMKLCVSESPVRVDICNSDTQEMLFRGFIVPNSYNQQLSGVNDIINIECVDYLGYSKYVEYQQEYKQEGFAVQRLLDPIIQCLFLVGFDEDNDSLLLPTTVKIARGENYVDDIFLKTFVGEDYFFTSNIPDEITGDYIPKAMTCEEVLNMIAESLHLTWISNGSSVILSDVLAHHNDEADYKTHFCNNDFAHPNTHRITEDSFEGTACTVSSLPHTSMVEVKHELADEIVALQDPFDKMSLKEDGEYEVYYNTAEDPIKRVISIPLRSELYDVCSESDVFSQFVAWQEQEALSRNGAFSNTYAWPSGNWNIALKMYDKNKTTPIRELLRRKIQYTLPAMGSPRGTTYYAETRLYVDVDLFVPADDVESDILRTRLSPPKQDKELEDGESYKLLVSVKVGNLYFDPTIRDYTDVKAVFPIAVMRDGKTYWDTTMTSGAEQGIPIPTQGPLEFVLYSGGVNDDKWDVAWLKKIKLTIGSSTFALRDDLLKPTVERVGVYSHNKVQSVTPPLDTYYTLCPKPLRVALFPDGEWGGAPHLQYTSTGNSQSLVDYIYSRANIGDRLMWEMTLRDDANIIKPIDVCTCDLWAGLKAIVGYSRDIINNCVTITLV